MQDFEWIHRAFIGVFGSLFSIVVESYSLLISIIAGTLTAFYMFQQVLYMHWKKKHANKQWAHQGEVRDHEKHMMEEESKKYKD